MSINDAVRRRAKELDTGTHAVIATDVHGHIVYWSDAAEELYGWTRDEVLGKNIVDVTPTSISQPEAAQIMRILRDAESWSGEFEVRDRAGRAFLVRVIDSPVLDAYGKLIGVIGSSSRSTGAGGETRPS